MEIEPDSPHLPPSYLQWYLASLGLPTLLLIVGVTLLAMGLVLLLFLRGRGPAVPSAMMFVLPLPLIVGLVCFFTGSIYALSNMALGEKPAEIANWISYALIAVMQASSCFCPLLMLTLTLLTVLGFRTSKTTN